ncbi:hypothetical protein BDR07DRAFT_161323 [Suillus spraguei]|nr:hypothetical protein BDR07DRAFT_161323 [Suillus spraguei]
MRRTLSMLPKVVVTSICSASAFSTTTLNVISAMIVQPIITSSCSEHWRIHVDMTL